MTLIWGMHAFAGGIPANSNEPIIKGVASPGSKAIALNASPGSNAIALMATSV
eukprot:CAMPEP_0195648800 /NCGR_PEP_ID=MMETSP0815-20121206/30841_1 /TAXON_ID=97485 /ORGANISM="Prymnesium parvum, Strain Texoma1" /LENGTH=52 /DNA_ID=CAMNT_0040792491 /DNA_START=300 /DNA_END=458 /DNA_ORIENTATION=+